MIGKYIDGNPEYKKLMDYGCGDMPYLPLFVSKVTQYVTCDIEGNPHAEITIGADSKVPLPAESFDIVLSIQVLEHVEDVTTYLAEANRLLGKNGLLLLSTHGQWIWHPCPKDLWRWTHEGLSRIIEESGFKVIDTLWILGTLAYSSQLRLFYLKRILADRGPILKFLFHAVSFFTNVMMSFQDKLEKQYAKDNAAIYFVVAKKM
ncbi:MAG: methyltransferase domain-containing protein [Thermodesulfovibrionales bacterium]